MEFDLHKNPREKKIPNPNLWCNNHQLFFEKYYPDPDEGNSSDIFSYRNPKKDPDSSN